MSSYENFRDSHHENTTLFGCMITDQLNKPWLTDSSQLMTASEFLGGLTTEFAGDSLAENQLVVVKNDVV